MPEVINYRFRLRRALKATWEAISDVLLDGEIGWARDTGELKVGDGTAGWNSLPYLERGIHLDRLGDLDAAAKADGKIIKWDAAAGKHVYVPMPSGGGGGGGRVLLYESTLASPGLFDTNDAYPGGTLPNGYRRFEIEAELRGTVAAAFDFVNLVFNGDTTAANYRSSRLTGGSSAASAAAEDSPRFFTVPAGTATAGYMAYALGKIKAPGGSNYKMAMSEAMERRDATTQFSWLTTLFWESTAAITRIQVQPDGAPTDQFAAGSNLAIWGVD